jgi:hypothetical protein
MGVIGVVVAPDELMPPPIPEAGVTAAPVW